MARLLILKKENVMLIQSAFTYISEKKKKKSTSIYLRSDSLLTIQENFLTLTYLIFWYISSRNKTS